MYVKSFGPEAQTGPILQLVNGSKTDMKTATQHQAFINNFQTSLLLPQERNWNKQRWRKKGSKITSIFEINIHHSIQFIWRTRNQKKMKTNLKQELNESEFRHEQVPNLLPSLFRFLLLLKFFYYHARWIEGSCSGELRIESCSEEWKSWEIMRVANNNEIVSLKSEKLFRMKNESWKLKKWKSLVMKVAGLA